MHLIKLGNKVNVMLKYAKQASVQNQHANQGKAAVVAGLHITTKDPCMFQRNQGKRVANRSYYLTGYILGGAALTESQGTLFSGGTSIDQFSFQRLHRVRRTGKK